MINNMDLRKEIIRKRKELSFAYKLEACDVILDKLVACDCYKNSDNVLLYADANGEVLTDKIILRALLDRKNVYLPVSDEYGGMEFYHVYALEELYTGAFGIREPLEIEYEKFNSSDITDNTICIVPGVVFDLNGNRMGYGRGYYDRYLTRNKINNRIGIAYDFQIVSSVEAKHYDVPMTMIITN